MRGYILLSLSLFSVKFMEAIARSRMFLDIKGACARTLIVSKGWPTIVQATPPAVPAGVHGTQVANSQQRRKKKAKHNP